MNNVLGSNFLDTIRYECSILERNQDEYGDVTSSNGKNHVIKKLLNNCCERYCSVEEEKEYKENFELYYAEHFKEQKKKHKIITDSGWWIDIWGIERRIEKKNEMFKFYDGDLYGTVPEWFWL
jgi:hypothetical protein